MPNMNRRAFLRAAAAAAAMGAGASPAFALKRTPHEIATVPSPSCTETHATAAVRDPAAIRILQFTDLHFHHRRDVRGPARDNRTIEDMHRLVEMTAPDVVAVTGDLWHDNPDGRGAAFMRYGIEQCEALGVPWLFTWGNHDLLDDYTAGHDAMRGARNCLYRGGPGGGNYTVGLVDADGAPVWDLVCLNTTNVGIQPPQEAWLENLLAEKGPSDTPAFCMLHIPVLQYDYIWEEEIAAGFKFEAVCSWGEAGAGIWHLQRLGNMKALFCGHDHVNDYGGHLRGVELVYGRATGHAGYGGDTVRKGAKLITANAHTGEYTWHTVFPDGTRWRPEPGQRLDEVVDAPWMRFPVDYGGEG